MPAEVIVGFLWMIASVGICLGKKIPSKEISEGSRFCADE